MKTKFTIMALICCLLYLPFNAKAADPCEFTGQDGDYTYSFLESGGKTYITFKPVVAGMGSASLTLFYGTDRNAGMPGYGIQPNVPFELNIPNGTTVIYFAFDYSNSQGPGNKGNYMPETSRYSYVLGSCAGTPNTPPTVSLTSPLASDTFTSPATVNLSATANDSDGTIAKVEFYSGAVKIGESSSTGNPYTFSWTNVQPGTYSLTAKATDDKLATTTSTAVIITVGGTSTETWCGNGSGVGYTDELFNWKAETTGGSNVKVTLHPKGVATGSDYALLIVTEGGTGGLPMTLEPSGNFTYTYNGATGSNFKFYFVYRVGAGGPETNNSDNQITYTIGTSCSGTLPVSLISFNSKLENNGSVNLTWATAAEQNNSYFLLERSADGKNFAPLQKIASKGSNSQTRLDYQFTDTAPLNGNNYYRLTQVDLNGNSKIVGYTSQQVSLNAQALVISPNPLSGNQLTLNLGNAKATTAKVVISSIHGAILYNQMVSVSNGIAQVSVANKPVAGIYLVKVGDLPAQKLIIK